MFSLDRSISLWLFNFQSNLKLGWIVKFFGVYSLWLILLIFVYVWFRIDGERKKFYFGGLFLVLLILGRGILVEIIRFYYHRPRPFSVLGIHPLQNGINSVSFPSGHTVSMFLMAILILYIGSKKWGWFSISLAILGAISRVMMGIHWFYDIVGGFFLAVVVFYFVYYLILPSKLVYKKEVDAKKT